MLDVVKIFIVFMAILLLLRLKWNVGYVLLVASALIALLYLMPLSVVISTIFSTAGDIVTIKLFFSLTLIRVFELILREKQVMARMMEASRAFLRSRRAVIISMPLLIGMLPSVGGAYFSAPMVDEATKDIRMSPEEKGFINYWYRHPWEYILPLYPGLLLASALTNLELRSLIMANMTYAVLMLVTGFMFSMKRLSGRIQEHEKSFPHATAKKALNDRIWSFVPIALVLISVGIFDVQLHYALGAIVTGLFVFYKFSFKEILRALKYGFALEIIVLIIGIMLFKFTLENSGAVVQLSRFFSENNIPLLPMLVLLPFVCGLLTGLSVGFVGSAFPLLVSISGGGHLDQISLAFAAGTLGVLLSPVHVCLILTREYFKADAWGIYKKIFPSAGIIMGAAFVQYFFF